MQLVFDRQPPGPPESGSAPVPPVPPVVLLVVVGANDRLKVGTLKAGAAKSVVTLRLTAPGMRSAQMLMSPSASRLTLLVAVVPVPPVVLDDGVVIVSRLPKSRPPWSLRSSAWFLMACSRWRSPTCDTNTTAPGKAQYAHS